MNGSIRFPRRALLAVTVTGAVIISCGQTSAPTVEQSNNTETPAEPGWSAATSAPIESPTDPGTSSSTPADSRPPQDADLGGIAEQDGYFLQVVTVVDPVVTDGYVTPGKRPVEVEVIVGNISAEPAWPADSHLIAADGQEFEEWITWAHPLLSGYEVGPGQRERGWIGFEVPENARIEGLRLDLGIAELYSGLIPQPGAVLASLPPRTIPQYPTLGEEVALDGYTLTALRVVDPAQPVPGFYSSPSNIFVAKEGMRLVAVETIIENVSGRELFVYPGACLLIDTEGFIYLSASGAVEDEMNSLSLNPGARTSGLIAFPIPPTAEVEAIKCEIGSLGVITILATGLTK
jgi:hypothetical protein